MIICEVKPFKIFGCLGCSRSLNRSQILKFEKFPDGTQVRIQKFWNRSGVGKSDSVHLQLKEPYLPTVATDSC